MIQDANGAHAFRIILLLVSSPEEMTPKRAWELIENNVAIRRASIMQEILEDLFSRSDKLAEAKLRGPEAYAECVVSSEIAHTRFQAQQCVQACCDAWDDADITRNGAFYRSTFRYCLRRLFQDRKRGLVRHKRGFRELSVGAETQKLAQYNYAMGLGSLEHDWKLKLELFAERCDQLKMLKKSSSVIGGECPSLEPDLTQDDMLAEAFASATSSEQPADDRIGQADGSSTRDETSENVSPNLPDVGIGAPQILDGTGSQSTKKSGPTRFRSRDFCQFIKIAREKVMTDKGRVTLDGLLAIATALDSSRYPPPEQFLEESSKTALKQFNDNHASYPIDSWMKLVESGNGKLITGMRRLISRYANDDRD